MRNRKGFTMVELIVTVCVLAILAALGVTAYVRYIDKAEENACLVNRTELAHDYEDYRDLFESGESLAAYVDAQVGGLDNLCPGGGTCSCGEKDGKPYIFCSKHDASGSGSGSASGGDPAPAPGGDTGGGSQAPQTGHWELDTSGMNTPEAARDVAKNVYEAFSYYMQELTASGQYDTLKLEATLNIGDQGAKLEYTDANGKKQKLFIAKDFLDKDYVNEAGFQSSSCTVYFKADANGNPTSAVDYVKIVHGNVTGIYRP